VCGVTAGVDDTLGDPFVVKVKNFLPEMEIVDHEGATRANTKRILVICNRCTLRRSKDLVTVFSELVEFASAPAVKLLVVNSDRVA
jgi:hypothetical protein